jgi:hypothetical protein
VEWATRYEGGERSLVLTVVAGFGVLIFVGMFVSLARAIAGAGEVRVVTRFGERREPTRVLEFTSQPRGGARARPVAHRSR